MKAIKLLLGVFALSFIMSCSNHHSLEEPVIPISLNELLNEYDLWYVDYHSTTGTGEVTFMSMAFTISFLNGNMYANNNLVGIGSTGDGIGIKTGTYGTYNMTLEANHVIDGFNDFEVVQLGENRIKLYNRYENVTYYLEGYQTNTFDYDQIFYDNIEYFLQEYVGWEKTYTSVIDFPNAFDYENFLAFTPENITTFYSSEDPLGTDIDLVFWDYVGGYEVFDVEGFDDLKILTLDYEGGDNEEFELVVIDDETIELYQVETNSIYEFTGRSFLEFLKNGTSKNNKETVSIEGRKRTKVKRKTKIRKKHLK